MALTGEKLSAAVDGRSVFEALLRALHPERERAAERYEEMRQRLRRFFRWRGAPWADELVDETMDRVGRRLAGGEVIQAPDVGRYFLGVARNVLRESWQRERQRGASQNATALTDLIPAPPPPAETLQQARLDCMDRCLAELPADTRDLVLRYYRGQGASKIADRRALAAQLGVTLGNLRIRLQRLRERLEACVRNCMAGMETFRPAPPPGGEEGHE